MESEIHGVANVRAGHAVTAAAPAAQLGADETKNSRLHEEVWQGWYYTRAMTIVNATRLAQHLEPHAGPRSRFGQRSEHMLTRIIEVMLEGLRTPGLGKPAPVKQPLHACIRPQCP